MLIVICPKSKCKQGFKLILKSKFDVKFYRWMGFSAQEEPIHGTLGRLLRRPVLDAEISSEIKLPDIHQAVEWVIQMWLYINSLLPSDTFLGPLLLQDCPLHQEEAKTWFIQKWNKTLAPFLSEFPITDPKPWILSTIPWKIRCEDILSPSEYVDFICFDQDFHCCSFLA